MRLRFLTRLNPAASEASLLPDEELVTFAPMVALSDGLGGLDTSIVRPIGELRNGSYNYFAEGDLLLAKVTPCFENGKKAIVSGIPNGVGFATSEVHVVRIISDQLERRYLNYLFSSETFRAAGMASMTGAGGLRRVSEDAIRNFRLPICDPATQHRIADFLDRETARIDQLIEKKQRLVELLEEKESSAIDRAIQGKDLSTSRKSTTVPWLPDVPEHWNVLPLRRLLATPITDGPHETPELVDDGVIFISAESIQNGEIDFDRKRGFISHDDDKKYRRKYAPQSGDIYVVKSGATTGRSAMVGTFTDFNIWSPLAVLRPDSETFGEYLLQVIRSRTIQDAIALNWSWGTQQNLGMGVFGRIHVPVPPKNEQEAIIARLRPHLETMKLIRTKTIASQQKLREFRSALITAAVTGQIGVDEWQGRESTDRRLDEIEEEMRV